MRDESKAERQREIEAVAYRLIRDRGYGGVSMLAIAKEAKASNETLYRWYGNKRGLLTAMVERNAQATADMLRAAIEDGADAIATLERIAPILLSMLLGEKAILLNRAAASDETGELGAAINLAGRSAVFSADRNADRGRDGDRRAGCPVSARSDRVVPLPSDR